MFFYVWTFFDFHFWKYDAIVGRRFARKRMFPTLKKCCQSWWLNPMWEQCHDHDWILEELNYAIPEIFWSHIAGANDKEMLSGLNMLDKQNTFSRGICDGMFYFQREPSLQISPFIFRAVKFSGNHVKTYFDHRQYAPVHRENWSADKHFIL